MRTIVVGFWRMAMFGWWWAAPLAFVAAWAVPEYAMRTFTPGETAFARSLRVTSFLAASAVLLVIAKRRRVHPRRFVFDPALDRVTVIPLADRCFGVTLAQWAWLALPLCGWAVLRVV